MARQTVVALVSGLLFGAGLAISGMADPARVRAFLDIFGAWDPTLAFVMAGALVPMAIAWRVRAHLSQPVAAPAYDLPDTRHIDGRLIAGGVVFGIGWGVAGLCPGPAVVGLALEPARALLFVLAMLVGMALHRVVLARPGAGAPTPLMRT